MQISTLNEKIYIKPPILYIDDTYSRTDTIHTLKDNGDGTYRYTKYYNTKGVLKIDDFENAMIDANLSVSEDESRPIYYQTGSGSSNGKTSSRFTSARNSNIATLDSGDQLYDAGTVSFHDNGLRTTCGDGGRGSGGNSPVKYFWCYQTHYVFD